MVNLYRPIADQFIVTTPANPQRALPVTALQAALPEARAAVNGHEALRLARKMATPEDTILMTGSFYLIKEAEKDYD